MKIYTKTGDKGSSRIIGGHSFAKSDLVFEAIGALDELNAVLGFTTSSRIKKLKTETEKIQRDLFVIGAYLADSPNKEKINHYLSARTIEMEKDIDVLTEQLPVLKKFILPGGTSAANHIHQARSVCRRAERRVVAYVNGTQKVENQEIGAESLPVVVYLNRLSDYLYILSRFANFKRGVKELEWDGLNEI